MAISNYLARVWSATDFGDPELSGYAESQLQKDTRIGVQIMALLALCLQLLIAALVIVFDVGSNYLYTTIVLAILSLHILISARFVKDVRTLQVLGMAFLIIGALAITFLAHRAGDLNIGMMAAIVMLFIAIPLVPWAVREAVIVVGLTYVLLTSSLVSVPGRFASGSLWVLQILLFAAAVVVVVVAARNTFVRKQDIRARFDLESAHDMMERLSMQDHLTGAWNRRFLDEHFPAFAAECARNNRKVQLAVLDIDDFKGINDQFGHQAGDAVLMTVAETFMKLLSDDDHFVRLGGDEFLVLHGGDRLEQVIETAVERLQQGTIAASLAGEHSVTLSAGIANTASGELADLDNLYRRADKALYAAKQQKPSELGAGPADTRTGQWKL